MPVSQPVSHLAKDSCLRFIFDRQLLPTSQIAEKDKKERKKRKGEKKEGKKEGKKEDENEGRKNGTAERCLNDLSEEMVPKKYQCSMTIVLLTQTNLIFPPLLIPAQRKHFPSFFTHFPHVISFAILKSKTARKKKKIA